jgi:hypothetical protein
MLKLTCDSHIDSCAIGTNFLIDSHKRLQFEYNNRPITPIRDANSTK